jgi:hypothetical protein
MVRRLVEGALIAAVSSAVTWVLAEPRDSASVASETVSSVVGAVARVGGPWTSVLWLGGIGLLVLGLVLLVVSMAPVHRGAPWQVALSLPLLPTTLMGVGSGISLIAFAMGLAVADSWWSLPVAAVVVYWAFRWVDGIRYRWTRMAGGL